MRTRLTDRLEGFVEDPNTGEAGGVMFNLKGKIVSMLYKALKHHLKKSLP